MNIMNSITAPFVICTGSITTNRLEADHATINEITANHINGLSCKTTKINTGNSPTDKIRLTIETKNVIQVTMTTEKESIEVNSWKVIKDTEIEICYNSINHPKSIANVFIIYFNT